MKKIMLFVLMFFLSVSALYSQSASGADAGLSTTAAVNKGDDTEGSYIEAMDFAIAVGISTPGSILGLWGLSTHQYNSLPVINDFYYTEIGINFHVFSAFALRPLFSCVYNKADSPNEEDNAEMFVYSAELNFLYYGNLTKSFSLYTGPLVSYTGVFDKENTYYEYGDFSDSTYVKKEGWGFGAGLLLGGQYMFNNHIGLYAEIGLAFNWQILENKYKTDDGWKDGGDETATLFSTRGATLGIMFYFN